MGCPLSQHAFDIRASILEVKPKRLWPGSSPLSPRLVPKPKHLSVCQDHCPQHAGHGTVQTPSLDAFAMDTPQSSILSQNFHLHRPMRAYIVQARAKSICAQCQLCICSPHSCWHQAALSNAWLVQAELQPSAAGIPKPSWYASTPSGSRRLPDLLSMLLTGSQLTKCRSGQ